MPEPQTPDPALVATITQAVMAAMQTNGQQLNAAPPVGVIPAAPVEADATPLKGPFQENRANAEWQKVARAWAANPDATWAQLAVLSGVWADHPKGPVEGFRRWRTNPKVVKDMAFAHPRTDSAPNTACVDKTWLAETVHAIPLSNGVAAPVPSVMQAPAVPVQPAQPTVPEQPTVMPWEAPPVQPPQPAAPAAPTMEVATARTCIRHAFAMRNISNDLVAAGVWKKADGTVFKRAKTYGVSNPEYLVNQVRKAGYDPAQIARDLGLTE